MANMKTDDSGVITTEFYTGRCPVRCEMCFVNFGEGGQSVPFTIYSGHQGSINCFDYASCNMRGNSMYAVDRLQEDSTRTTDLSFLAHNLCGPSTGHTNDSPRNWEPVTGVDRATGKQVEFFKGMDKTTFKRILKPMGDDRGLYSIPKVPEIPWVRKVEYVEGFNGQTLPAVLRVNSMSDSSVAPSAWIAHLRDLWGDDCFFNTNVHAIKRFSTNIKSGLYHKMVVTTNPGLQHIYPGLDRYKSHHPKKQDVASDPDIVSFAREVFPEYRNASADAIRVYLSKLPWDKINGLITLVLAAGTMKGMKDHPWHFLQPARISDIDSSYAKYEKNIKFYRVRALPTIQPVIDRFDDVPVVYTVLRFKTIQQAVEFSRKYEFDVECVVKDVKDAVVCDFYMVPYRFAAENEDAEVLMKSDSPLNGSPNRGEWTSLKFKGNFFRCSKKQMDALTYVCDRSGRGCKGCGLCACLDGTESNWQNPKLAKLGLMPKTGPAQSKYLCDMQGMPVATKGVVGRVGRTREWSPKPVPKAVNWSADEMDFYKQTMAEYGRGYRTPKALEEAKKAKERAKRRRLDAGEAPEDESEDFEQNPARTQITPELFQLAQTVMALEATSGRRRNPTDAIADALQTVVDYGSQGTDGPEDFWVQGWNTHEEAATTIAQAFWHLMVYAHERGLAKDAAVDMAVEFCENAVGMDLFEDDLSELSNMYDNTSYWNDEFGPTA